MPHILEGPRAKGPANSWSCTSLHQLGGLGSPFCLQHFGRVYPALGDGARRIQGVCHQRRNNKPIAGCRTALELTHIAMVIWKTRSFSIIQNGSRRIFFNDLDYE